MAECGICLGMLRKPVSVPCGHVHCEMCLRTWHMKSGKDSLKSTCSTCRKLFHTTILDLKFVPQKYHDFILPCVRKVCVDIPSVATLREKNAVLTQRLESIEEENENLRRRCKAYKNRLKKIPTVLGNVEDLRDEMVRLHNKYTSMKKKYEEAQSHNSTKNQKLPRQKRASPKSPLSNSMYYEDEDTPQNVKRQRTGSRSPLE